MMFVGGIYKGKKGTYLSIYNFQYDVYIKPPESFGEVQHLDHFSYKRGGKKGGGDVFLITDIPTNPGVNINKEISLLDSGPYVNQLKKSKIIDYLKMQFAPENYDIQHQIINLPKELHEEVISLINADIVHFCGDNEAKNPRGHKIDIVDKIIPKTQVKYIKPEKILTGGKQWFVPSCKLEANIDFGKGCISGWVPEENAGFDGKFFTNYLSSPNSECDICYAKLRHRSFPKTIYEFDKKRIVEELSGKCRLDFDDWNLELGKPVDILRFGKRTETAVPFFRDSFIGTLEAMVETGTRGIIPTKYLEYDKEAAGLLKKTNSVVLYSIGFDQFEKGACAHGCNNQFRQEQAAKYNEAGVKTALYLLIIGHKQPSKIEQQMISSAKKQNLFVQLLPATFQEKKITYEMTGQDYDYLKGGSKRHKNQATFHFSDGFGAYIHNENRLRLEKVHPEWLKMIENNNSSIRMCHHTLEHTYCGGCFQENGEITGPPPENMKKPNSRKYQTWTKESR